MTHFTPTELDYLNSQKLGRLATLDADGAPNNVPVGFRYNAELDTIDIGGYKLLESKKSKTSSMTGACRLWSMMCCHRGSHAALKYGVSPKVCQGCPTLICLTTSTRR